MGKLLGATPVAALSLALLSACTPEVGLGSGGGTTTSVNTATTATGSSSALATSTSTGVVTTNGASSSGSGGAPATEFLYTRAYPAAGSWTKTSIKDAFPSDPNRPSGTVVSAVALQEFQWMLWLTSDGQTHVELQSGWQAPVALDTLLSIPANCKKINQHKVATNCVDDANEPACVPVSTLGTLVLEHVPPSTCGGTANTEGLSVISGSVATLYTVSAQALPPSLSYGGQRDYLTDCSPDDPGATSAPLWGFQIARPSSCPGDWYDTYVFRADHQLYMQNAGDVSAGTDHNVWPIGPSNPLIVSGDPNQPDLTTVTAAYYSAANAKLTLIAP